MNRKGFSLIEMLVVIGILSTLIGISVAVYSRVTKSAERARAQELVSNVATALSVIYQKEGSWPRRLAANGASDGRLDANAALALAKYKVMGLNTEGDDENMKLIGLDKFGLITPWATAAIKRAGKSASPTTPVGNGAKQVQDHILHYALDLDGDGIIRGANVGGNPIDVRAQAIVWCCGPDGSIQPYSKTGGRKGGSIYSWQVGQTKEVQ